MGLSTTYANIVLCILILISLTWVMDTYTDGISGTTTQMIAASDRVKMRIDTSIDVTSVSTSGLDVIFLVINDGKESLGLNCTDFFVDRQFINKDAYDEFLIIDNTFDTGVWNPGETLKMRTQYDIDDADPHEGRTVTCNGVADSLIFYD